MLNEYIEYENYVDQTKIGTRNYRLDAKMLQDGFRGIGRAVYIILKYYMSKYGEVRFLAENAVFAWMGFSFESIDNQVLSPEENSLSDEEKKKKKKAKFLEYIKKELIKEHFENDESKIERYSKDEAFKEEHKKIEEDYAECEKNAEEYNKDINRAAYCFANPYDIVKILERGAENLEEKKKKFAGDLVESQISEIDDQIARCNAAVEDFKQYSERNKDLQSRNNCIRVLFNNKLKAAEDGFFQGIYSPKEPDESDYERSKRRKQEKKEFLEKINEGVSADFSHYVDEKKKTIKDPYERILWGITSCSAENEEAKKFLEFARKYYFHKNWEEFVELIISYTWKKQSYVQQKLDEKRNLRDISQRKRDFTISFDKYYYRIENDSKKGNIMHKRALVSHNNLFEKLKNITVEYGSDKGPKRLDENCDEKEKAKIKKTR